MFTLGLRDNLAPHLIEDVVQKLGVLLNILLIEVANLYYVWRYSHILCTRFHAIWSTDLKVRIRAGFDEP